MEEQNRELSTEEPIKPTSQTFSFEGSGKEYFRIWIVNIALTILTLGIYSAWAKVRTNRYIYANTYLNGSNFEYNADPIRILVGRLIVVGIYAAFVIFSEYLMMFEVAGFIALLAFIAMPWLVRQAVSFKMRNTSYRNIPFRYSGKSIDFYIFFIYHGLLNMFTLFLLFPYSYVKFKQLVIGNAHYGHGKFRFYGTTGESYATFILVFIWSILFVIGVVFVLGMIGALIGGVFSGEEAGVLGNAAEMASVFSEANASTGEVTIETEELGENAELIGLLAMGIVFLLYLPIVFWQQGFSDGYFSNFVRNSTSLEQAPLKGMIKPFKLGVISATNVIAIMLSLGFLYPWARIRYLKYKLEHTGFACKDYEQFESSGYERGSTVGEEMVDFFDIDIGL
ncbi:MAG: DUF898 domain-containing protein [Epsilonproteobacteria bacterium]|nr:DUF898 domain-containing protein [Campylobacterota bacterium]